MNLQRKRLPLPPHQISSECYVCRQWMDKPHTLYECDVCERFICAGEAIWKGDSPIVCDHHHHHRRLS